MKKSFCDECGEEMNNEIYGNVNYNRGNRDRSPGNVSYSECIDTYEIKFEVCSRKCLFKHLRKNILKDVE